MKKVLQISKYMYPFIGGIEQVVRDISGALHNCDNVEQKIICFNEDAIDGDFKCCKNETITDSIDGVEVIRCGYFAKIASQSLSVTYGKQLKKVLDEFKPDVIIFHYPNPFVAHYLLKYKKRNFKLILYWHLDITKQKILSKLFNRQNIKLINRADLVLGATPRHIKESLYSRYFNNKSQILPYMIDEKRLKITQKEIEYAEEIRNKYEGEILGLFIGRHVQYKGLEYLIRASKELKDVKIHFFVAGSGELTDRLKELSKDDSKIEFIGRISDSEKRSYLYACDIFCFPSITRNEAFGLALAEAMYFGKPAVTFTILGSGVNYVNINEVTGFECKNQSVYEYAEALKKLSEEEELRLLYGKQAKERVLNNFTEERFYLNVRNLIESI